MTAAATIWRTPSVPICTTARSRLSSGPPCGRYSALLAMRSRLAANAGSCAMIAAMPRPEASGSFTARISCGNRCGRRGSNCGRRSTCSSAAATAASTSAWAGSAGSVPSASDGVAITAAYMRRNSGRIGGGSICNVCAAGGGTGCRSGAAGDGAGAIGGCAVGALPADVGAMSSALASRRRASNHQRPPASTTAPSSPAASSNTVTSIMEKSSDQCDDYPRSRSRRQCERC